MMTENSPFTIARIVCALALGVSAGVAQADMSKAAFDAARTEIKASYKTERDACGGMNGNAKDICNETADGREKVALAHLQMQRTGTAKDKTKLAEARYEARYAVAKEKCDDLNGDAKNLCVTTAKTEHDKAKADVKMNKDVREARNDAEEAKIKADYKLASERCDTLNGNGKAACVASAKARFGM